MITHGMKIILKDILKGTVESYYVVEPIILRRPLFTNQHQHKKATYEIVSVAESFNNTLDINCPLIKAMQGKVIGDIVEYEVLSVKNKYQILDIIADGNKAL